MSLRTRLSLLFLSFLILVTISVVVTAWAVNDQNNDALVINLAGRQRMLAQQISNQALQIQIGKDDNEYKQALRDAETVFDQTLSALIEGGETSYLSGLTVSIPETRSGKIRHKLEDLRYTWNLLRSHLETIQTDMPGSPGFESAMQSIQTLVPQLVYQADDVVWSYETESERKIARLRWIQTGFFVCAVGLLVVGVLMTRRDIVNPLQVLKDATEQIGQGDLDQPLQIVGPPEFNALAASFDTMRSELKALTENLEARVVQRTRELTALFDVICEISARLKIEHVLQSVTSKARDLLNSEVAFLCLLDDTAETMVLKAYDGHDDAVCTTCVLVQHSVAKQVLQHHQAMICDTGGCQTVAANYRVSHLVAPLHVGDQVIGALCVGSSRPATYSQDQVRLLTELANSTAIALENARLYEQAERVATLEERQRIAADIHDGLAQTLGYMKIKADQAMNQMAHKTMLGATKELRAISEAIDRASRELRHSIANLRSHPAPHRTLQQHLTEFAMASSTLTIDVVAADEVAVFLEPDEMAQVLRVVQEALQNVRRHAQATRATVIFTCQGPDFCVVVNDNGCGFDHSVVNHNQHFGLSIMQARAARLRGKLAIQSAPGQGTRLTLSWPARSAVPS